MQFPTILELFSLSDLEKIETMDDFYGCLIPRFFESLETTAHLSWAKVGNRYVAKFDVNGQKYHMYVEAMDAWTKIAYGINHGLKIINLGFALVNDEGEEQETLQSNAENPIKVFSIIFNGFKEFLPKVIRQNSPDVITMMVSGNELQRFNLYARLLRKIEFDSYDFTFTATTNSGDKIIAKTKIEKDRHQELKNDLKSLQVDKGVQK